MPSLSVNSTFSEDCLQAAGNDHFLYWRSFFTHDYLIIVFKPTLLAFSCDCSEGIKTWIPEGHTGRKIFGEEVSPSIRYLLCDYTVTLQAAANE